MAEQQGTNGNRWTTITIGGLLLVVGLLVGLLLGQDGSDDTADLATQGEQDVSTTSAAPTTTESPAEPDAPTTSTTAPQFSPALCLSRRPNRQGLNLAFPCFF